MEECLEYGGFFVDGRTREGPGKDVSFFQIQFPEDWLYIPAPDKIIDHRL